MPRRKKKSALALDIKPETVYSIVATLLIMFGLLVIVSFSGQGRVLATINTILSDFLGLSMLYLPFIFIASGLVMFRTKWAWSKPNVLLGTLLLMIGTLGFLKTGIIGLQTFDNVSKLVSPVGSYLIFATLFFIGVLIIFQTSITEVVELLARLQPAFPSKKGKNANEVSQEEVDKARGFHMPKLALPFQKEAPAFSVNKGQSIGTASLDDGPAVDPMNIPKLNLQQDNVLDDSVVTTNPTQMIWEYPPLSLLDNSSGGEADRGDVKKNAQVIEHTLDSFGIRAKVEEVNYGPSVTQYGLSIAQGTKLSKITNLATDLALALAAPTGQIRIEAPIAGRSLVGIEVPNYSAQFVTLRHMLASDAMKKHKSKLAVALGIDVAGQPKIVDIGKMPHVLIAGSTGSGKSVCVNTFMCSVLFRASPAEVKFILVDPKRVELTAYNDIPHLLVPVIVDAKKVVSALRWATHEMDKRYKQLAEVGVKNIDSYNELAGHAAMPNIVIIIDELADVMLFAPAEVEECITRIAQMARAVGIHLVLATQRPSVDVLTGLIKANVPTRIAFNVSSMTDSRVILDSQGAEKLLGRGDMLYVPPDQAKPSRIQGTYVTEKEIHNLIQHIKSQGQAPQYEEEITVKYQAAGGKNGAIGGEEDRDELFDEAVMFVARAGKGSSSMIQRQFSVGYNRAARILDQMYAAGMVGPQDGSKPREVNAAVVNEYMVKMQSQ